MNALLEVRGASVDYTGGRGFFRRRRDALHAVKEVSFSVPTGAAVGLVGESGSGKSSLARAIVGLQRLSGGEIEFDGHRIDNVRGSRRRALGRDIQMVFQDPYASLNPRLTVRQSLAVTWRAQGLEPPGGFRHAVDELLDLVGLSRSFAGRYPHQFSGGQRQRVGIARAIALRPRLVVCDEAVSALDVSIRAQIINLLADLRQELGLSYLFIAHDLSVVRHLCDEVVVLQRGEVVESGTTDAVFDDPQHAYTQMLLDSIPVIRPWDEPDTEAERTSR